MLQSLISAFIGTYEYVLTFGFIHVFMCMYVCMYLCMYVCECVSRCVCPYRKDILIKYFVTKIKKSNLCEKNVIMKIKFDSLLYYFFTANAVSLIPWVPAEILAAKLAVQNTKNAIGMNEMITQIYRKEGILGFFKGFFSSLACHVTYSFTWWVSYSTTRRQVEIYFPSLQQDNKLLYDAITGIKNVITVFFYTIYLLYCYYNHFWYFIFYILYLVLY